MYILLRRDSLRNNNLRDDSLARRAETRSPEPNGSGQSVSPPLKLWRSRLRKKGLPRRSPQGVGGWRRSELHRRPKWNHRCLYVRSQVI